MAILPAAARPAAKAVLRLALLAAVLAAAWAGVFAIKLALDPSAPGAGALALQVLRVWAVHYGLFLTLVFAVAFGHRLLPRRPHASLGGLAAVVSIATLSSVAALLIQRAAYLQALPSPQAVVAQLPYLSVPALVLSALLIALLEFDARGRHASRALHDTAMRRLQLQSELERARYALLHSQVEPHFLFNSLANVRRLLRTDRAAARDLLSALMRYLEEALPQMRAERGPLAREAELVRAFLAVHRVRMGERLDVHIDVPDDLGTREVPTMVLLTLAENAIKHGLAPLAEGGRIEVAARREGGRLVLCVADTGQGLGAGVSTQGTGLANLRARLAAMYGSAASLSLQVNQPRGLLAQVSLPEAT